jgi:hypothetical protein
MNHTALLLEREKNAALRLKERLTEIYGDDVELIRDMIEGETNIDWLVGRAARELLVAEGEVEGAKAAMSWLAQRSQRAKDRAEGLREVIKAALIAAERDKYKDSVTTISITAPRKKMEINMEELPRKYTFQPPREADKELIRKALAEEKPVPGVYMIPGEPGITVRFK